MISKKWLLVLVVAVIALLAFSVPVLASSSNGVTGSIPSNASGFARFCGMMRGWENTVTGCFSSQGGGMWGCR